MKRMITKKMRDSYWSGCLKEETFANFKQRITILRRVVK